MEKAKNFMEKYQEMNAENAWEWKFLCYFFEFGASGAMLGFPDGICLVYAMGFWTVAMIYRMKGYLGFRHNMDKGSIYEVLKYTPINPWDIYRIFQSYLIRCIVRRIIFLEIILILLMLRQREFSLQGVFLPIICAGCMFLGGVLEGIPWKYWKKNRSI